MREGPKGEESTKIDPFLEGLLIGTIRGGSVGLLLLYGAMSQYESVPLWQQVLCLVVGFAGHDCGEKK